MLCYMFDSVIILNIKIKKVMKNSMLNTNFLVIFLSLGKSCLELKPSLFKPYLASEQVNVDDAGQGVSASFSNTC